MMITGTVLLVDDDPKGRRVLSAILHEEGYRVRESAGVQDAIRIIRDERVDAVISDVRMPVQDGFQLFDYVRNNHPRIPVIFLTAFGSVESAVDALTKGAHYYFIKPPDYEKLKSVLRRAIEGQGTADNQSRPVRREAAAGEKNSCPIIGSTRQIERIRQTIEAVKNSESSVLIQGETGTGKEVVACNLHYGGIRSAKPFVAVNCAAIPRDLLESELFGYERGAFTGATASRLGKFEEASGGTVFLDEIGELELSLQAKLLRALQERMIERLGSNRKIRVDFRLICSTNRNLSEAIAAGTFREDLFYRINVVQIDVPRLRERTNDIPLLAAEFVDFFCRREKKAVSLSRDVLECFRQYAWPGNVRQLKNIIERAVVLARDTLVTLNELPAELRAGRECDRPVAEITPLKALERQAIRDALRDCGGNKSQAARKLGISRKALYKRLSECPAPPSSTPVP